MHGPEDDFHLGKHVIEQRLVPREVLLDCLLELIQERRSETGPGFARPLGVILTSRGLLTQEQLSRIMQERADHKQDRPLDEMELGHPLAGARVMSPEDVERCLGLQEAERRLGRKPPTLGELVVREGYATDEQVMRALSYENHATYRCGGCAVRVMAPPPPAGHRYRCKRCSGELLAEPPRAPSSAIVREAEQGEDQQIEIDRAVAAYLKQKQLVRRDRLRDAQRVQMELSRYGLVVPLKDLLRKFGALTWQQERALDEVNLASVVRDPDWKKQALPGYRLQHRIAAGGYATIHAADPMFGGARVAVKILHREREMDERAVARFEREAALLARMSHPGIIHGLEHGCERGRHYLVMEFVEGRSLGQAISEGGPFPVRNALKVVRQIADALRYLHAEGYLHRDIKPDNVLLDVAGRVKLCDLGFATPIPVEAGEGQRRSTVVGTAGYISPEQVRGEADVKVGADIYALGITLYALLTGYEPFKGASSEEVVTDQIEGGMPVPNLMIVKAPPAVVQFLGRMMHHDRLRRFRTVVDVGSAMDRMLK